MKEQEKENENDSLYKELRALSNMGSSKYNLEEACKKADQLLQKGSPDKKSISYRYALYVKGLNEIRQLEQEFEHKGTIQERDRLLPSLRRAAAKLKLPEARYRLAYLLRNTKLLESIKDPKLEEDINKDLQEAKEEWESRKTDADALYHLGKMYAKGMGVDRDPKKAYEYYSKAIELNHTLAMNNLAWAIQSEFIPKQLYAPKETQEKALELLEQADALGAPFAAFNLGAHYLNKKEYETAMEYLQKAQPIWNELMGCLVNHTVEGYFAIGYYNYVQATKAQTQKEQTEKLAAAERFFQKATTSYRRLKGDKKNSAKEIYGEANLFLGLIYEFYRNAPEDACSFYEDAAGAGNETAKELDLSDSQNNELTELLDPVFKAEKSRLHIYAREGDIEEIKNLINNSRLQLNINLRSKSGETVLHFAVKGEQSKTLEKLLDDPILADINAKNLSGNTALHLAAERGQTRSIKILINQKAKLGSQNNLGETALYLAAKNGYDEATKYLLGITPVIDLDEIKNAIEQQNTNEKLLKVFEEFRENPSGKTLLHIAAENGDIPFIKLLKKVNLLDKLIPIKDATGSTALILAGKNHFENCVSYLLGEGAIIAEYQKGNISINLNGNSLTAYEELEYRSIIDLLKDKEKYAFIISVLVKNRKSRNFDETLKLIKLCADELKNAGALQKKVIIKKFVNPLTYADTEEIKKNYYGALKFYALYFGTKGHEISREQEKEINFEWGQPEHFLPINIKYLFMSIVNDFDNLEPNTLEALTQELCVELEMLQARRDYLAADESKNSLIMQAYIHNSVERILRLAEGETCVFNSGYRGHSIYHSFTKQNGKIYVQIDNLADTDKKKFAHIKSQEKTDYLYPYMATIPCIHKSEARDAISQYFANITYARKKKMVPACISIYTSLKSLGFTILNEQEMKDMAGIDPRKKQDLNNCVVENFNAGLFTRMEKKGDGFHMKLLQKIMSTYTTEQLEESDKALHHKKSDPLPTTKDDAKNLARQGIFSRSGSDLKKTQSSPAILEFQQPAKP